MGILEGINLLARLIRSKKIYRCPTCNYPLDEKIPFYCGWCHKPICENCNAHINWEVKEKK